jgi:uncharacterized protein (TIGR03083 family)
MDTLGHRVQLGQAAAEQLTQYLHTLPAEAWHDPSACEGWNVHDVVGHLTWVAELYAGAISRGVQGDASPLEGCPPARSLEKAALSAFIAQRSIACRESLGEQLLTTFTARHIHLHHLLHSLSPQQWETPCYHPNGIRPAQQFIPLWLAEVAMHAWDIWSVREPSRPLFAESLPTFLERIPGVVAVSFQPGARLRVPLRYGFAVTGAVLSQYTIVVEGDTVHLKLHEMPEANVLCRCDSETFVLLMYGRLPLQSAISSGRVVVEGDQSLIPTFGAWFKFV